MADAVTTQILENGPRYAVFKFTSVSDGTGESGVVKIDATSSGPLGIVVQGQTLYPGPNLKLVEIKYSVFLMGLRIQWQGTPDTDMMVLQATDHWELINQRNGFGGIYAPSTISPTGSIKFTTIGAGLDSGYTILMTLTKGIPQS